MKIYILGASGGVGAHVVNEALRRKHDVTVHARQSSHLSVPSKVNVIRRELTNAGAFEKVPGHDVVISCLGLRRANPSNPFSKLVSPPDLCSSTMKKLMPAMADAGIRRIVAVSAAGVGDSHDKMNLMMKILVSISKIGVSYRDLDAMEQMLAATSLDWFCVRPATLTDKKATGKVNVVDHYASSMTIARADVASFMLDRAEDKFNFIAHTQQIANT